MPQINNIWEPGSDIRTLDSRSISSSIYSQEQPGRPLANKYLIPRQNSPQSAGSSIFQYSEENIKALGYRPFEYWKGPEPAASSSTHKGSKRTGPVPARLTNVKPSAPVNSLNDFKPMPDAKLRELQEYMEIGPAPRSPTVKEKYRQRQAEIEERRRRREHLKSVAEWPGWVPDAKAYGVERARRLRAAEGDPEKWASTASMSSAESRAQWYNPCTWTRRTWAFVAFVFVLVAAAGCLAGTLSSSENVLSKEPRPKILTYRLTNAFGTEDLVVSLSATSPSPRSIARHFWG